MHITRLYRTGLGALIAIGVFVDFSTADAAGRFDPARPIFKWSASPKATGAVIEQQSTPSSRYTSLISKYAMENDIPVALAHAVVRIESNFNERARGGAGEIGLMQIKPATARMIGFSGKAKALYDPATNLQWGMKYLGGAHQLAGGDTCGTILRYNAGHYARRMNPISARYCRKVKAVLKEVKTAPQPTAALVFFSHRDRK